MKKIEAVVRPNRLDEVKSSIIGAGAQGVTVADVSGFEREVAYVKIEAVVPDGFARAIVAAVQKGGSDDETLSIAPVEEAVRIRTGERGYNVL